VFECDPLTGIRCGAEMKIVSFITEPAVIDPPDLRGFAAGAGSSGAGDRSVSPAPRGAPPGRPLRRAGPARGLRTDPSPASSHTRPPTRTGETLPRDRSRPALPWSARPMKAARAGKGATFTPRKPPSRRIRGAGVRAGEGSGQGLGGGGCPENADRIPYPSQGAAPDGCLRAGDAVLSAGPRRGLGADVRGGRSDRGIPRDHSHRRATCLWPWC
jgi:hypothetical protein